MNEKLLNEFKFISDHDRLRLVIEFDSDRLEYLNLFNVIVHRLDWVEVRDGLKCKFKENIKSFFIIGSDEDAIKEEDHRPLENTDNNNSGGKDNMDVDKSNNDNSSKVDSIDDSNIVDNIENNANNDNGNNKNNSNSLMLAQQQQKQRSHQVPIILPPKRPPLVEHLKENETYEEFDRIWEIIESDFETEPPFTIQRLAELALYGIPNKHNNESNKQRGTYNVVSKYLRAINRVVLVTSSKYNFSQQFIDSIGNNSNININSNSKDVNDIPLDSVELTNASAVKLAPASVPSTPLFSPIPFLSKFEKNNTREISPLNIQQSNSVNDKGGDNENVEDFDNVDLHRPTSPTSSNSNAAAAAAAAVGIGIYEENNNSTGENKRKNNNDINSDEVEIVKDNTQKVNLGIVDELDAGKGKVAQEPVSLSATTTVENENENERERKRRKSEIDDEKLKKNF